jgi:hypothetical protein
MGEKVKEALRVQFDKRLRLEFQGARITSDGGLLACRELDGALEQLNAEWVDRAMMRTPAPEDHPGHGQLREPCIWGAGRSGLQRSF